MNLCPACDAPVPPSTGRRPRVWCSPACAAWAPRHPDGKRIRERSCAVCGVDISHLQYKAKVCSKHCNDVQRGKARLEPLPNQDCTVCGNAYSPSGLRSKYCSAECRSRRPRPAQAWVDRKRPHSYRGRVCEVCGEFYDATWRGQRTCSRLCGAKIHAGYGRVSLERRAPKWFGPGPSSPVWFPKCRQCGKVFTARSKGNTLCSAECRRSRALELDTVRRPRLLIHQCVCGESISSKRKRCAACLKASQKARRQRDKRRRRAAKRGAVSEPYTLMEIASRDRNVCQLCKKRVAISQQVPHPKAPVIDHVLPLARGGDDTRANVQLAHFLCNSVKSAGGSQQLALVG